MGDSAEESLPGGSQFNAVKLESAAPVPPSRPQYMVPPAAPAPIANVSASNAPHPLDAPSNGVAAPQVPAPLPMLVPSLKGKMIRDGSWIVCNGVWAMSEAQHANPDFTSEFEFRINSSSPAVVAAINAGTIPRAYPLDGLYEGWFKLRKQPPLKGSDKIDEKGLLITFRQDEEDPLGMDDEEEEGEGERPASSQYVVEGQGSNRFGNFTLKGSFDSDTGDIVMYREYVARPLKPIVSQVNRVKRERQVSTDTRTIIREGTGRIRKQSSFVTDFDNMPGAASSSSGEAHAKKISKPEITPAQRIALQFQRCKTLHADIIRMPQAVYFLEPVDPISLNIPDYPLIITNPMDLGTVGANLHNEIIIYQTHMEFADAMRLVFKNALTYNSLRDNLVNIAARECLSKFEEKYRAQVTSLNAGASRTTSGQSAAKKAVGKKYPGQNRPNGGGGGGGGGGVASSSSSGGGGGSQRSRPGGSSGGAGGSAGGYDYAAIPDGSMAQMLEMQRQMLEMQNELNRLRNAVGQDAALGDSGKPLTLQEKKDLIHHISDLQPSCMEKIVQIVQQGAPERGAYGDVEDIEIPLDELDTYTLRKLQAYVNDARKRGLSSSPAHKRARSSAPSGGVYEGTGFVDDDTDYSLFPPESF